MNFDFYWLVIKAYKNELITRNELIEHLKGLQMLGKERVTQIFSAGGGI